MASAAQARPRKPWLAAIIAFFSAPAAFAYAGALRRGFAWWGVSSVFWPLGLAGALYLPFGRAALAILFAGSILLWLIPIVDAYRTARRRRTEPARWYQRWWMYVLLLALVYAGNSLAADLTRAALGEAFVISARSMEPTAMAGDRLLASRCHYKFFDLSRGDLVVYFDARTGTPWIKRVIALAGDRVEVRDEVVYLNGTALDEPYAWQDPAIPKDEQLANMAAEVVPPNQMFVLGDNRRRSRDSRIDGCVDQADLIGMARVIYFSMDVDPDARDRARQTRGKIRWERIGLKMK